MNKLEVPVLILAGGFGTRLKEQTVFRPKPMVEVGGYPIIWHIMKIYSHHGFRKFIVCAGFKSQVIKDYFINYHAMKSDFTVRLAAQGVTYHDTYHNDDWEVTIADTGEATMTGGRVAQALERYLGDAEHFALTYGDGVANIDLSEEFDFHLSHGKVGTLVAVHPPSRFGELVSEGNLITSFNEKPELVSSWINGGFFFFKRKFANFLHRDETLVLEQEPLKQLAAERELMMFRHSGFWQCMDTQRDKDHLDALWAADQAPWAPSKLAMTN